MKNLNKMKIAPDMQYEIGQDKVGYFPEWSVKDDATLWQKVENLAHSTYVGDQKEGSTPGYLPDGVTPLDPKKFIKIGSLNITDDGIASGFNSTKYLKVSIPQLVGATNYVIEGELTPNNLTSPTYYAIMGDFLGTNVAGARIQCNMKTASISSLGFSPKASSSPTTLCSISNEISHKYKIEVINNVGKVYIDGVQMPDANTTFDMSEANWSGNITLGNRTNDTSGYFTGSMDLKQFSITVDGVEVFSGNKTGIDIIKPTNFTVDTTMYAWVYDTHTIYADSSTAPTELYNADGTLHAQSASEWQIVTTTVDDTTTYAVNYNGNAATYTSGSNITASTANSPMVNPPLPWDARVKITADGILSNIKANNGIQTQIAFNNKSFIMEIPFCQTDANSGATILRFYNGIYITQHSGGSFDLAIPASIAGASSMQYIHTGAVSTGKECIIKIIYNQLTKLLYFCAVVNGVEVPTTSNHTWTLTSDFATQYIYTYNTWGTAPQGTINLNKFKVYIADDLDYQSMLYIPYTEAELNNKVVDVAYRDRVKDLFEQKGYNIYYTLGEDDFTFPSNKPNDIVKYKANGLTVAEQRADQTLTIRGACESGVDVNLPMEFFSADSYAVFGVGTTGTNTASKFTPAADGNYIAIGKGKV